MSVFASSPRYTESFPYGSEVIEKKSEGTQQDPVDILKSAILSVRTGNKRMAEKRIAEALKALGWPEH